MAPSEYQQWRRGRVDRAVGIGLGIALGIAVVIVFVFYASRDTIDAPSIDDHDRPSVERQTGPRDGR